MVGMTGLSDLKTSQENENSIMRITEETLPCSDKGMMNRQLENRGNQLANQRPGIVICCCGKEGHSVPHVSHRGRETRTLSQFPSHAFGQAWKGNCDMATDIIDLFAVNPHAAYYIKGIVDFYPVKFILDTGAAVSLLDVNVWNTIKGEAMLSLWNNSGLV